MTWDGLSGEMLQFRRRPMEFLAVVLRLRVDATSLSPAGVLSFVHLGLWCNDGCHVIC